ncbi:hypothetical protein J6590_023417 [Homalodisca vitripennis]|nr:hypothetical protein J6590_023417 [Homalodisca vitripennis]
MKVRVCVARGRRARFSLHRLLSGSRWDIIEDFLSRWENLHSSSREPDEEFVRIRALGDCPATPPGYENITTVGGTKEYTSRRPNGQARATLPHNTLSTSGHGTLSFQWGTSWQRRVAQSSLAAPRSRTK